MANVEENLPHGHALSLSLRHVRALEPSHTLLTPVSTFSTTTSVPATGLIQAHFNVSRTVSILTLTVFTIGLAFGPLFIAPMSEMFGRRPVYMGTLTSLLVFTAGAGASRTFASLIICRFLAGFFGSATLATGAGTVADVWGLGPARGKAAVPFILGPFLGPTLGPLAGAYVLKDHGQDWRWSQWVILCVGAPIWVGVMLMKETSSTHSMLQRSKSDAGQNANTSSAAKGLVTLILNACLRATKLLFQDIIVLSMSIYTAFAYGVIFSYFASGTYVLTVDYDFNLQQVGLSFISVIIGYLLGGATFFVFTATLYKRAAKLAEEKGLKQVDPEHRLYAALFGSVWLSAGLFWYAWAPHRGGHWSVVVASGIFVGWGAISIFLSAITYLVDTYKARLAASALAANGSLRFCLGATFPLFTIQMYSSLGIHWAGSVYAFLSLFLLPIPWLLFKYGPALRRRSKFAPK